MKTMSEMKDHGWKIVEQWVKFNKLEPNLFVVEPHKSEDLHVERNSITGRLEVEKKILGHKRRFKIAFIVSSFNIGFFIQLFDAPGKQDETFYRTISEINAELVIGSIKHHHERGAVVFCASQLFSESLDLDLLALIVEVSFNTISGHLERLDSLQLAITQRHVETPDISIPAESID